MKNFEAHFENIMNVYAETHNSIVWTDKAHALAIFSGYMAKGFDPMRALRHTQCESSQWIAIGEVAA